MFYYLSKNLNFIKKYLFLSECDSSVKKTLRYFLINALDEVKNVMKKIVIKSKYFFLYKFTNPANFEISPGVILPSIV